MLSDKRRGEYACDQCQLQTCFRRTVDRLDAVWPADCPSVDLEEALGEDMSRYRQDPHRRLAETAWEVNRVGRRDWTRLEATMEFARRGGFQHLGLAFCIGLAEESATLGRVLRANGFTVSAVPCSIGSPDWPEVGIENASHACNPSGQALALDVVGTEINIAIGLCVGDDALFSLCSTAPVITLACKDKVTGHHPMAPLYTAHSYYKSRLFPE